MEPFVTHRGRVAVLDWSDINTDLIIPARYLKRIEPYRLRPPALRRQALRPGATPAVDDPTAVGPDNPEFPLNDPSNRGASVLVVGRNFGCGSSREHAVWAVAQGLPCRDRPGKGEGFADIFEGTPSITASSLSNLPTPTGRRSPTPAGPRGADVTIDLRDPVDHPPPGAGGEQRFNFEVSEADRHRLLNGLDAISETLLNDESIRKHEQSAAAWLTPQSA